ncbi:hypothetical protein [Massilia sp. TSP1-1-2]|uniref:hypothetical protein n=1 Tax=Massilia sp. TSP1-1-2 TaxID=2804649 RepID=UPI003CEB4D37
MKTQQATNSRSLLGKAVRIGKWAFLIFVALLALSIMYLLTRTPAPTDPAPPIETSIAELRKRIDIQIPIKSVQWQEFGSPEYLGAGAPGPTDNVILVAEMQTSESNWFKPEPTSEFIMRVVPESARPWLSEPFKAEMKKSMPRNDYRPAIACKDYSTTFTKTKNPVEGFICAAQGKVLLYLWISSSGT